MNDRLPPKDVGPSELFQKLLERPQPSDLFDFPLTGRNGGPVQKLRILVLPMEQHEEARMLAVRKLKDKRGLTDAELNTDFGKEVVGDAVAREVLSIAVVYPNAVEGTDPPVYPRLFRDASDVAKLTADEVTVLFGAYMLIQRKFGPYERGMDEATVNAWIERLTRGASDLPLVQLDSRALGELVMQLAQRVSSFSNYLASQRESLPTLSESIPDSWLSGTSSVSAQPAESTPYLDDAPEARAISAEEAMAAAQSFRK